MSATMKAVIAREPGGPDQLVVEQQPQPEPQAGEVCIKVAAAGVNRLDCLQRMGHYPPPDGVTSILGLEVSGEIVSVGEGVDEAQIGKSVIALVPGGGYAEFVVVANSNTLPVPAALSMEEAACVPETFFTVWHNVFERGGLQWGESFLVHGGTSGIGSTAIQLAKAFGAQVFATAGSAAKCEACLALGADHAINYREADFAEVVKTLTGGRGVDVILDMVGGSYVSRNYECAAIDGRIVQIAFLKGAKAEADFRKLMIKRLTHTGSTLRARSVAFKSAIAQELAQKVFPLIEAGQVRPVIDRNFNLADADQAHAHMEAGSHIGKIVLTV